MKHPKLNDVDPALLTTIGAVAMDALEDAGWLERRAPTYTRVMPEQPRAEQPRRSHRKKPPARAYASAYRGVSVYRERWWLSHWSIAGKGKSGRLRERTAQGERWAAQDRARALGLEYLEMRDGTCVPYAWKETQDV